MDLSTLRARPERQKRENELVVVMLPARVEHPEKAIRDRKPVPAEK